MVEMNNKALVETGSQDLIYEAATGRTLVTEHRALAWIGVYQQP